MSMRSNKPDKGEQARAAIYTRKTAIFGEKSKLSCNDFQRMACEEIVNLKYNLVVSSKKI